MKLGLLLIAIVAALTAAFIHPYLILALLFFFLAIVLLARNLYFGLVLLVFFFPYLGLVIDFGSFKSFREVPYLRDVNAPFIDLYALLFFVAWLLSIIIVKSQRQFGSVLPYFKYYLLFWLSGLLSLVKVPSLQFAASLKYFARPFTFAYAVFFAPVVNILTNHKSGIRSQAGLLRVLTVFYFTGLLSAVNGFFGLLFGPHFDFPRAQPLGLFGISPLGANHNLLSETLIATAPAGLLLGMKNYELRIKKLIWWGMFFQWAVALLTFARTAWIAVAVQAIIYAWLTWRGRMRQMLKRTLPLLIPLALLIFVLATTIFTETVRGSTASRLDQARIAAFYFAREPILGNGVGTFLPSFWGVRAFLLEYGEPLEAHGVLFKLAFEQGILGLLVFAILTGAILRGIRRGKGENVAALMIAAGSLTYQLFNTTYYTSKLWVPLAIAVAISRVYEHSRHNPKMVS